MSTIDGRHLKSIAFQVYPESGNIKDTLQRLVQLGLSGWCSPLHFPKDGKPHYHVECIIFNPKSKGFKYDTWGLYVDFVGGANGYFEEVFPHDYAAYLIHKRQPDKQQFPLYEVVHYDNNLNISCNIGNVISFGAVPVYSEYIEIEDKRNLTSSKKIMQSQIREILKYCRDNHIVSYALLVDYCMDNMDVWLDSVLANSREITSYMRSMDYTDKHLVVSSHKDDYSLKDELNVLDKVSNDGVISSRDIDILEALNE